MKNLWQAATGPSAGLVQQHYVESRKQELARRNPELEERVRAFLESNAATKGIPWLDAYHKIQKSLQAADLTLNFEEEKWFADDKIESTLSYDSYTQMYERSLGEDGKVRLADSNVNTGAERARVDDAVTFPPEWAGNNANQPQRGLMPGRQSGQRIMNQMQFGSQKPIINRDLWSGGYGQQTGVKSLNPHFNPKAKQVFAALNYGRRPHGSSIFYGHSYLQLSAKLKVNALYYPGDTFFLPPNTSTQVAYGILGAVMGCNENPELRRDVVKSCYSNAYLGDTKNANLLLEAHLFERVVYSKHLVAVYIPAARRGTAIHGNAKRFAEKYGVKVVLTS